jgi:hypothetical protein
MGWLIRVFVLTIPLAMPTLAGAACKGLATASPDDLLGIPGGTGWAFDWLPPGVRCSVEGLDRMPPVCTWDSIIARDRMIGDERRLLLVSSTQTDGQRWDYLFVLGCVAGEVREVLQRRFRPGVKIARAEPARLIVEGSDQPESAPRRIIYRWNERRDRYESEPTGVAPRGPSKPSCSELATIGTDRLLAIRTDMFPHGMGCYSLDPDNHPDQCEWKIILGTDRMIGSDRRLVVVGRDHLGGSGAWSDVFVFGCVDGRLGTLFYETFEYGPSSDVDVSPNAVTLSTAGWANDPHCCPSREDRLTYAWSAPLQSYVLRSVRFAPRSLTPSPAPTSDATLTPAHPQVLHSQRLP